jgi:3-oxoacyl-[acyl-carrier-protein] synthase II
MNNQSRVVITGLGVVSPIGIGKDTYWSNLIQGTNGIREIESMDTAAYRTHRGGEVLDFDMSHYAQTDEELALGRASQFAIAAAQLAWQDAELTNAKVSRERIGVACGTTNGESRIFEDEDYRFRTQGHESLNNKKLRSFPVETIPSSVARHLKLEGPVTTITTACAAGNFAIGHAVDLIRAGRVNIMLAGGSDPFSRTAFTGFNSLLAVAPERCQPFDRFRRGMCVSEGAALLVLESLEHAEARGAHIYAEVLACGISNDAHHMTAPHPSGLGAITAMRNALAQACLIPEKIDYISAHGTGTPANDKIETAAVKEVFGKHAYATPMSSIKSMLGHTMGAASALEAVACSLAIETGLIPPTINYCEPDPACDLDYVPNQARNHRVDIALSNAFAFGGNCTALLLANPARL